MHVALTLRVYIKKQKSVNSSDSYGCQRRQQGIRFPGEADENRTEEELLTDSKLFAVYQFYYYNYSAAVAQYRVVLPTADRQLPAQAAL